MWNYNFYIYIITNLSKSVLYTGVTNDLDRRIYEHKNNLFKGFSSKYACHYLLYYERHNDINHAIVREKEIKGWRREKKLNLIRATNPEFRFLNDDVLKR